MTEICLREFREIKAIIPKYSFYIHRNPFLPDMF